MMSSYPLSFRPHAHTLVAAAVLITTSAFAGDVTQEQATASCEAATGSQKAAAEVGMEWTTTGKLIKTGLSMIEKGEFADAMKKCDAGKFQGDAAVEQARLESERWKARVPK